MLKRTKRQISKYSKCSDKIYKMIKSVCKSLLLIFALCHDKGTGHYDMQLLNHSGNIYIKNHTHFVHLLCVLIEYLCSVVRRG